MATTSRTISTEGREVMDICEKCTTCRWYWQNNDGENECQGSANPCLEYIEQNGEKQCRNQTLMKLLKIHTKE